MLKINASTKSLVERLCDFKISAISVLSFIGSVCAPSRLRPNALQCTTAGPYKAILSNLLGVSALRLAIELLHVRPRLAKDLRKSKRLEGITALLFSLSLLTGSKDFLHLVAPRTLSILFVAWTVIASLMRSPQDKKQKVATGFLRDKLYGHDFAGTISLRASKYLGPISRYRVVDILHHMKHVSRACRPGLLLAFFAFSATGHARLKRFHTEDHENTCRVGCPNDPDSLSLQRMPPFV